MPQDREGARTDPNHVPCPPHTPKPLRVYPHAGAMIYDTQEALFDLEDTLLQHRTTVQGNVDQGVDTSKVARYTDHTGDPKRSEHRVTPHPCTLCGGICYGPTSNFQDDGLLRYVSITHSFLYYILFYITILNCFVIYLYFIIYKLCEKIYS